MASFNFEQFPVNLRKAITYQDLAAQQVLFYQNDPSKAIFAVDSGQIKLIHYTEAGKTVNHYVIQPGEYFAEVALFNEVYVCSAIAEIPSRIIAFPKEIFLKALEQNINLSKSFTEQLARRLHYTKLLLELRGIRSARDRILHYLQVIIPPNQKTFYLDRSLKDIANDIGISPEAFSRTLAQLQHEGLLTRTKGKITLTETLIEI
jgi:CRP/FNR family transcriptional regulator, dissimilatory nitrate respiration regulator